VSAQDDAIDEVRDTEEDASSVRPSAPTLQGAMVQGDSSGSGPGSPVVIRTPMPPAALDRAVGALTTTTPTGRDPVSNNTLKSGGPPSSPRGLVGVSLGRYEIVEELGHGGMATVYRAHDPRLGRDVALKVIHRHLRDNGEIAQRFRHEARAVAKLKHPSIVEIYDVPDEAEDGERFLVAELVEGPSLRRYLQLTKQDSGGAPPMPAEIAAALVLQILAALARAHEDGIIHRDVKPENILLANIATMGTPTPSQRPSDPSRTPPVAKLTDFGIAKLLDAQGMTSTGQILGSPAHMSPEQIEGGDISARVDIFAVGVLFYELSTGVLPFDGKNPAQVIRRVLDGEFVPAERQMPTVGGRWSAIIASMLAREPENRPRSAEEVALRIRAELEALGVHDPNRELVEYLRSPTDVGGSWGARLKPKLLERAIAARNGSDVVGAANDLNRALAYDPSDPKLVRAVSTIRTRERRIRQLKRGVPLAFAALLVSSGTFGVVKWVRKRAAERPVPSVNADNVNTRPSISATTSGASSGVPVASAPVAKPDAGPSPSGVPTTTGGTATTSAPDAGKAMRTVRINIYPAHTIKIDGGVALDPMNAGPQDLTIGDHMITAEGTQGCCVGYAKKWKVAAGEGVLSITDKMTFNPARIFVQGLTPGHSATVTVTTTGGVSYSGGNPLAVPMTDTTMEATVTVVAIGFQKASKTYTLMPGNPTYVDLTPE
jgi:serine/threonine protein kinase